MALMHDIDTALRQRRRGYSLERDFYTSPAFFEEEMRRVFMNHWLYVGHESQIPRNGDYLTYNVAGESILIARTDAGALRAMFNVCRHRGARVVQEPCGNARQFRCPYHAWSYLLDGSLKSAPGMNDQICKSDLGLMPAWVESWEGFIYANLSDKPPAATVSDRLAPAAANMARHRLRDLKIARTIVYDVPCNWKLLMENYRECYHCYPAHPQFVATVPVKELDEHREGSSHRLVRDALGTFTRYSLRKGAVSQSISGEPVSIPLGDTAEDDTQIAGLVMYPGHAMSFCRDHGFVFSLHPVAADRTTLTAHWYVNKDAVEGKDYHPDAVAEFWDITTRQDVFLCTINQQGIQSRRYTPGPYNAGQEDDVQHFLDFYATAVGGFEE